MKLLGVPAPAHRWIAFHAPILPHRLPIIHCDLHLLRQEPIVLPQKLQHQPRLHVPRLRMDVGPTPQFVKLRLGHVRPPSCLDPGCPDSPHKTDPDKPPLPAPPSHAPCRPPASTPPTPSWLPSWPPTAPPAAPSPPGM